FETNSRFGPYGLVGEQVGHECELLGFAPLERARMFVCDQRFALLVRRAVVHATGSLRCRERLERCRCARCGRDLTAPTGISRSSAISAGLMPTRRCSRTT